MSAKVNFGVTPVLQILKYPLIINFIEKYDDNCVIILFLANGQWLIADSKKTAVRLLGQQFFYSDNIFSMRRCLAVLRFSDGSKIL